MAEMQVTLAHCREGRLEPKPEDFGERKFAADLGKLCTRVRSTLERLSRA
jgi:hypothetical protein